MSRPESLPWYRYFWPWFIVALMGSAVLASVVTVFLAFSGQDSLVRSDWYREGTAINQRLELEREASRLGVEATLRIENSAGEISIELPSETLRSLRTLRLELSHPTQAERDRTFFLSRTSHGDFRAALGQPIEGRWYATLAPAEEDASGSVPAGSWQLSQRITLPAPDGIQLGTKR